mgnify:CR=1 FL=1
MGAAGRLGVGVAIQVGDRPEHDRAALRLAEGVPVRLAAGEPALGMSVRLARSGEIAIDYEKRYEIVLVSASKKYAGRFAVYKGKAAGSDLPADPAAGKARGVCRSRSSASFANYCKSGS